MQGEKLITTHYFKIVMVVINNNWDQQIKKNAADGTTTLKEFWDAW